MTGLFEFLAKLTDLIGFAWKRKAASNDKPDVKNAEWRKEIEDEVKTDNQPRANARVSDALFRWRMRQLAKKTDADRK